MVAGVFSTTLMAPGERIKCLLQVIRLVLNLVCDVIRDVTFTTYAKSVRVIVSMAGFILADITYLTHSSGLSMSYLLVIFL